MARPVIWSVFPYMLGAKHHRGQYAEGTARPEATPDTAANAIRVGKILTDEDRGKLGRFGKGQSRPSAWQEGGSGTTGEADAG
jgi:hypothetical protein